MTTGVCPAPDAVVVPSCCVACAQRAPADAPICSTCRRILARVCFGKVPLSHATALVIQDRERAIPGRENTVAYHCPVCRDWHNGRNYDRGTVVYADAVLICLKVMRFHADWLAELAESWRPPRADRMAWRAAVSPHRKAMAEQREEAARADIDPLDEVLDAFPA